jgi:hypothetical protein
MPLPIVVEICSFVVTFEIFYLLVEKDAINFVYCDTYLHHTLNLKKKLISFYISFGKE